MKSEEKVKTGMKKASNLGEPTTTLDDVKKWQEETEKMNKIIDGGNEAAHKMSMHDKVYKVYAANCKKCEAVAAAIKDWISKMEALVKMWESQAGKA